MPSAGPPVMGAPPAGTPATAGSRRPPRSAPEAPQATRPPRPLAQPPVHLQPCDVKGEITPQAPPTDDVPPCRHCNKRQDIGDWTVGGSAQSPRSTSITVIRSQARIR